MRWHSANVVQLKPALSQLWRLDANGERFVFAQGQTFLPSEPFGSSVGKSWRSLVRRSLNVAWLPPEKIYLRSVHLPSSDPAEVASMVELQMEKLSPLPVAQIVWGFEMLPKPSDKTDALQTVIVVIVARSVVEEYLGSLETKGYLADRVEVPCLDQLLMTKVEGDGVWIYVGPQGEPALIAWWYGGVLQNLALVTLTEGPEQELLLKNQLEQMAWAGELEGWLSGPPQIHLVAEPAEVSVWEPLMRKWSDQPLKIVTPVEQKALAGLSAARVASENSRSNLLPPEFTARYHQQFVDGLWMRGLVALLAVYAVGVVMYLTALFVLNMQLDKQVAYVAGITSRFKEAQKDKARIQILKDRQELKYAALDCWRAAAEALPQGIVLDNFFFQRGKFTLNGTAPLDQQLDITTFNEAMRKAKVNGELLFTEVSPPTITANAQTASWRFSCTLKGGEK